MLTRRKFIKYGAGGVSGLIIGAGRVLSSTAKSALPRPSLDFIANEMIFMPRSKWTNAEPRYWLMREAGKYDRLTLHHGGNFIEPTSEASVSILNIEYILAGHIERKYGDIAYHFIIDFEGRVWEGRSLAYEGAHVSGQNENNIGVMLLGNFEEQQPSSNQIASMDKIVSLLMDNFAINRDRIYGHRDLGQSACPGKNLYSFIEEEKIQSLES